MRIGIDIDDTITNTWDTIIPYYSVWFDIPIADLIDARPYYNPVKENYTEEEYFELIKPIYDSVSPYIPLKKNVAYILNKLHKQGHKIIFITSRGGGYTDSYSLTKNYLIKNNVYYDKLFVGIRDKRDICQKEKIDLFIDDSYKHCKSVSEAGIPVLLFENRYNKNMLEFKHVKSWKEVYNYIINK